MAIGRTFKEALQKGIRSMEVKRFGFGLDKNDKWLEAERDKEPKRRRDEVTEAPAAHSVSASLGLSVSSSNWPITEDKLRRKLSVPSQGRLYYVRYALKMGWSIDQIFELTKIDRWFLAQMKELSDFEGTLFMYRNSLAAGA